MALALGGLVSCFDPTIRDGQIACSLDLGCPDGFVCLEGLCRNTAPDGKGDNPDGDGGDDGADGDPGPMQPGPGPKLYSLAGGVWTARPAAEVFAASTIDPDAIQTGFSQCDAARVTRCWADTAVVACDFGAGWVDRPWSELAGGLGELSPTFGATFAVGAAEWDYYFHRGREWRGYVGPPLESGGALEAFASSAAGDPDLDEIYAGDPNAPSSFDNVAYDYVDSAAAAEPWSFVEADGRRFTVFFDGTTMTDSEPHLAIPGAPAAGDVRAALMCNGALELYALD